MSIKKLLKPWPLRIFLLRISKWVILVTMAISIMVIAVSIYAENVGNFIITIGSSGREDLVFYTGYDPKTGKYSSKEMTLFAPPIEDLIPATYQDIPELYYFYEDEAQPFDGLLTHEGDHSDQKYKTYYAYSFYLKNDSRIPIDYDMYLEINSSEKGTDPNKEASPKLIDDSLRVMVVKCEFDSESGLWQPIDGDMGIPAPDLDQEQYASMQADLRGKKIYAKPEPNGVQPTHTATTDPEHPLEKYYTTLPFYGVRTPVQQKEEQFGAGVVRKYTIVMWIEGNDPDCDNGVMDAKIRMTCNFMQSSVGA